MKPPEAAFRGGGEWSRPKGSPRPLGTLVVVMDSVRPISAVRALVSTNGIVRIEYISYLGVK